MAALPQGYNAPEIQPAGEPTLLRVGEYVASIVAFDKTQSKALQFTYELLEGPSQGRKLNSWHDCESPNVSTRKRATSELHDILRAVGKPNAREADELFRIPLVITVGVHRNEKGELVNVVKDWKALPRPHSAPQRPG